MKWLTKDVRRTGRHGCSQGRGQGARFHALHARWQTVLTCPKCYRKGPVVLAFFKVSCPVCQYAFPFLERLHKAYGATGVKVIGVSQDNKANTASFMKQFGITFPVLLDPADSFTVSNNYGLTNVPTVFWINTDSEIETSSVGWIKVDVEQINRMMAEHLHATPSAGVSSPARMCATFALVEAPKTNPRSRARS